MSLQDYRLKYPEYDAVPDDVLVPALYQKYGEAETLETFAAKIKYQLPAESVPESVTPEPSYIEVIKKGWERGKQQRRLGELRFLETTGRLTPQTATELEELKKAGIKEAKVSGIGRKIISATAEMLPIMVKGITEGQKLGLAAGMTAGGVSVASGPAAPVAVPAATALGYTAGTAVGSAKYIYEVEAGLAYDEFLEFKDKQGRKLDPETAKLGASIVGGINSLLEVAQIGLIIKSIPGGKKLLGEIATELTKKAITNPTLMRAIGKVTGNYAGFLAREVGQEELQEATNITVGEIVKIANNKLESTNIAPASAKEITNRLMETGVQSLMAFAVIGAPGTVTSVMDVKETAAPVLPEIEAKAPTEQVSEVATETTARDFGKIIEDQGLSQDEAMAWRDQAPEPLIPGIQAAIDAKWPKPKAAPEQEAEAAKAEITPAEQIGKQVASVFAPVFERLDKLEKQIAPVEEKPAPEVEKKSPKPVEKKSEPETLKLKPETKIIERLIDKENGIEAIVDKIDRGYAVALRDIDSGEYLETITIYKTKDEAIKKARSIIKPAVTPPVEKAPEIEKPPAKPEAKEPWEMTHQDYMYAVFPKLKPENVGPSIFQPTRETHRSSVEQALKEGKAVKPEVLADYPDLVKEPLWQTKTKDGKTTHILPGKGSVEGKENAWYPFDKKGELIGEGEVVEPLLLEEAKGVVEDVKPLPKPEVSAKAEPVTEKKGKGDITTAKPPEPEGGNPFKDSVVRDVVYHGTTEDFKDFNLHYAGKTTRAASAKKGIFFTSDPNVAEIYTKLGIDRWKREKLLELSQEQKKARKKLSDARYNKKISEKEFRDIQQKAIDVKKEYDQIYYKTPWTSQFGGANIRPVYLKIENPRQVDFGGKERTFADLIKEINKAKKDGNDGVIIKNIIDPVKTDVYVVFSPNQIKSKFDLPKPSRQPSEVGKEAIPAPEPEKKVIPPETLQKGREREIKPAEERKSKVTDKRIARFKDLADKLQKQIDKKRHPVIAEQNLTARRARIAASMAEEGDWMEKVQHILRGMANDLENNKLPSSLEGVKNKAQIEVIWKNAYLDQKYPEHAGFRYNNVGDDEKKRLIAAEIKDSKTFEKAKEKVQDYIKPPSKEDLKQRKLAELERELIGTKIQGFFPTPPPVVEQMLSLADIKEDHKVLEPSAGNGAIADIIREQGIEPDVIEIVPTLRKILEAKGYNVVATDFLEFEGEYDRIVMNPPFEKGQDIDHVKHAYDQLKPDGRLVSIMGEGSFFRNDKKYREFRNWFEDIDGISEKLESGAFKGAKQLRQTGVASRIVTIDKKPEVAEAEPEKAKPVEKTATKITDERGGVDRDQLSEVINPLVAHWGNRPNINILVFPEELPLVQKRKYEKAIGEIEGSARIKGFIDGNDVFLNISAFDSIEEATNALFHEVIGHWGINTVLPDRSVLQDIYKSKHKEIKVANRLHKFDITTQKGRDLATKEYIAQQATENPNFSVIQKVIDAIKKFLDKIGFNIDLSDAQIRFLISNSRKFIEGKRVARPRFRTFQPEFMVKAWHGGPHDVTKSPEGKFSTKYVGTGEGEQMFGWGIYFTELKDVGKSYAKKLGGYEKREVKGKLSYIALNEFILKHGRGKSIHDLEKNPKYTVLEFFNSFGYDAGNQLKASGKKEALKLYEKMLKDGDLKVYTNRHLYAVTLLKSKKPSECEWLDWYKTLDSQSDKVKGVLQEVQKHQIPTKGKKSNIFFNLKTGKDFYRQLQTMKGSQKEASLFLLRAGIDGIRYPEGSISGKGTTSKNMNYVVFDENAIDIDEHIQFNLNNQVRRVVANERGGAEFEKKGDREWFDEFIKKHMPPEVVQEDVSNNAINSWDVVTEFWKNRKKGWKPQKVDTKAWERLLSVPRHYFDKIRGLKGVFNAALERSDEYNRFINDIQQTTAGENLLKRGDIFKKKRRAEYKKIKAYLKHNDQNQIGYHVEYDDITGEYVLHNPKGKKVKRFKNDSDSWDESIILEHKDLLDQGYSEQAADAVAGFRRITHNGFDLFLSEYRKLEKTYKKLDKPLPVVPVYIDGEKVQVDLKKAVAIMGDRRGYYMPRNRKHGKYVLRAKKKGSHPRLEIFNLKSALTARQTQLQKQGYTIEKDVSSAMPEDVFELAGSIIKAQTMINEALNNAHRAMKKGGTFNEQFTAITERIEEEFALSLAEQYANIQKARGFRSHMIRRTDDKGIDVWEGYEEDPVLAIGQYVKSLAAGEAKKNMALKMMKAFTGTDETWTEYQERLEKERQEATREGYLEQVLERRVDPGKQKNAFRDGTVFMEDMLRNDEFIDDVIGMVKGLAVIKYLGGRVSAPVVNLTAMVTSVPATISHHSGVGITRAFKFIGKASKDFYKWRWGSRNDLDDWTQKLYAEIIDNGWHKAQYNKEALSVLRSTVGRGWDTVVDALMIAFGVTEQYNRIATIAGAYQAIRSKHKGKWTQSAHALAMEKAKEASDDAHAIYGKVARPYIARGGNPAARLAQSFYVFRTFSHNYLLTMKKMGFASKQSLFMGLSPAILAGMGASVYTPILSKLLGFFGFGDDPEEELYKWINETFGETTENWTRFGLFGLGGSGVSLKGSLSIGVMDIPTNLKDLLGAPGSMAYDMYYGGESILKGEYVKGTGKLLPINAIASMIRSVREYREGVTTRTNVPLFYGKEQLKPDFIDSVLRFMAFNPAGIAGPREKLWKERMIEKKYGEIKTDIYAKIRKYYLLPGHKRTKAKWVDILTEIREFNDRIKEKNLQRIVTPITARTIKANLKRAFKPTKKERLRK